jgi:hypothetical protein
MILSQLSGMLAQIANELGAEIIDEIPLCSGGDGPMVSKDWH